MTSRINSAVKYYEGAWGTPRCAHGHSYCKPCRFGTNSARSSFKDDSMLGTTPVAPKTFFWSNGVKYYANLICGQCDNAAVNHPITAIRLDGRQVTVCSREYHNWYLINYGDATDPDSKPDYYLNGIPAADNTGPGTNEPVTDDCHSELDFAEFDAVANWRDTNPEEHTSATSWWYYKSTSETSLGLIQSGDYSPEHSQYYATSLDFTADRSYVLEGFDGFYSTLLIDPLITDKFHKNLLNVFTSKRDTLMIGSVEITTTEPFEPGDKWVSGHCVNPECPKDNFITVPLDDTVTREYQEAFIWACVAHGNNHAIHFIRNKKRNATRVPSWDATDFTRGELLGYREETVVETDENGEEREYIFDVPVFKYHPIKFCSPELVNLVDPEDDVRVHYELPLWLKPKEEEEDVSFMNTLFDHQAACKNPACNCEALLKEQMPALV